MEGLSYQCRKALPKGLLSVISKRVPTSDSLCVVGVSLPVRKPPASGLMLLAMLHNLSTLLWKKAPEGVKVDFVVAKKGEQGILVGSADKVVLALIVLGLNVVVLLCYLQPFREHWYGEVGDAEL